MNCEARNNHIFLFYCSDLCQMYSSPPPPPVAQAGGGNVVVWLLLMYFPLFFFYFYFFVGGGGVGGGLSLSLFWYVLLCMLSRFAIIWQRKRELVALFCFLTDVLLLYMFLALWVCLRGSGAES